MAELDTGSVAGNSDNFDYESMVLLVDDQAMVGEAIRRMLATEPDIHLHYCADANLAVSEAIRIKPTVILQDLVMPGTDGLDLVRRYRQTSGISDIPVVVLSTREEPLVKSQAFSLGANDYIVKLPDKAEMIARIRYHTRAHLNRVQRDEAFRALRESQQRLLETNTTLMALNQQLNEFLGMAAHDLRNPLGIVLAFSKMMITKPSAELSPRHQQFLTTIHSSSAFMLHLVNDLLDISKIEAGELKLDLQATNLPELVGRNVELNRLIAVEKDIDIRLDVPDKMEPVRIDAHKIEQLLNNLLSNAIKFSQVGRPVLVTVRDSADSVELSVRDSGQGIPAAELDKLFRPFGVTSVRATAGEKSTGLGLAIAKKVVDGHGGTISVASAPGDGSTFTVTLPRA